MTRAISFAIVRISFAIAETTEKWSFVMFQTYLLTDAFLAKRWYDRTKQQSSRRNYCFFARGDD
jgi:hypothetical protein